MLAKESHLKSETYSYNSQNRLCESVVIDRENKTQSESRYAYDAFGSLVQGDLSGAKDLGYLGKQFDKATGLYNYGYRDYKPAVARFTTVDPIRDGTNWFVYCDGDSVNFVDLWGYAPRNMSEYTRSEYMNSISNYKDYNNKDTNDKRLNRNFDCADVATYLYAEAMAGSGNPAAMSKLEHNGKPVKSASEMQSKDYFPENANNISFYEDKSFNNPNVEIGTVAVWKGPGVNKKGGWIGHIATIVDVKRDSNSNVISITTIEGHTGGGQTAVEINSAIDWASYKGEFLGFGEIGRDSTEAFPKTTENSVKGK